MGGGRLFRHIRAWLAFCGLGPSPDAPAGTEAGDAAPPLLAGPAGGKTAPAGAMSQGGMPDGPSSIDRAIGGKAADGNAAPDGASDPEISGAKAPAATPSGDSAMLQPRPGGLIAQAERPPAGSLPCIALCGEFSAGKSSIVNLLLGCDMLPTSVLSSTRRPTYLRHAPSLRIEAVSDGGEREAVSLETIGTLAREDISHFDVGMPAELLRHVELLDTPGFADPFHDHQRTLDAVENTDVCLWCTLATQAWRESERRTWLSLPSRFHSTGILVVTHVDTLAHRGEHARVRTRLGREAGRLFSEIVLLSVPEATRAVEADGRVAHPESWQESGGKDLIAALQKAVNRHHAERGPGAGHTVASAGSAFGFRAAAGSAADTTAPQAEAGARATADIRPADAASGATRDAAGIPPADTQPAPVPKSERFLTRVMESVPQCLSVAWIDLAGRELLLLRGCAPGGDGANTDLGDAITDLFQGANVEKIEDTFRRARGRPESDLHYFQEIFIMTDACVGVFIRSPSRTDRALAVVTDKSVNLGMVLSRARSLIGATDPLP